LEGLPSTSENIDRRRIQPVDATSWLNRSAGVHFSVQSLTADAQHTDRLRNIPLAGKTNKPVPESLKRRLKGIQLPADAKCYELPVAPEVDPVRLPKCILRRETTEGDAATAVISSTDVFCREVEINPIEALTDTFHVQFTSQLGTAKDPLARQKNFELILSREELRELQGLIERTLN